MEREKWYLQWRITRDLLTKTAQIRGGFPNGSTHAKEPQANGQAANTADETTKPVLTMQKQDHYGQVLPMEDVEKIFKMVRGAVRLPCVCRRVTTGNMNARYCYGLTMDKELLDSLDDSFSLETLTKGEALESIRKLDKEGLVHSVWTFKTPFIGGLCNCDQDCMAYRITHARKDYPVMFRAEWVASISADMCNGCRLCMRQCQYGALRYSSNNKKVVIDPSACYGCGVCRAVCNKQAITLSPREAVAGAAGVY